MTSAMGDVTGTVAGGPLPLALLFALLAGLVSFLSPCVLPLVPGYLGYVTGLSEVSLGERRRHRMVLGATTESTLTGMIEATLAESG